MIFNEELLPRHHLPLKIKFVLESSRARLLLLSIVKKKLSVSQPPLFASDFTTNNNKNKYYYRSIRGKPFLRSNLSRLSLSLSLSLWSRFLFLHFSLQFLSLFGSREFEGKHKKKKKKKKVRKPKFSVWLLFRISSDFDLASVGVRFRQTQIYDSIFFICFVSDWISLY